MVLTNLMEIDAHFAKWRRELSLHFAGLRQCFHELVCVCGNACFALVPFGAI